MKLSSPEGTRWMQLSLATVQARRFGTATSANALLKEAATNPAVRRLHPALLLWTAENFTYAADFPGAIDACSRLRQRFGGTECGDDSFLVEAEAHRRLGDTDAALRTYETAARGSSESAQRAQLEHGMLLEQAGRLEDAVISLGALLKRRPAESLHSWFDRIEDAAERCIRRCRHPSPPGCSSPRDVAFQLARALREGDFEALRQLASPAHFGIGVSELSYLGFDAIADGLKDVLARSCVLADPTRLDQTGGAVGLVTTGWSDPVVIKRILFQISEEPSGWRWTGVTPSGAGFMPKLGGGDPPPRPHPPPSGPPPVSIKAPWPAGECLRAGGLNRWGESFIPIFGWIIQLEDLTSDCGYGAYGYYYGQGDHQNQDHYAIDYTAYFRLGAYITRIPSLPALAAHDGVVTDLYGNTPYGVKTAANFVNLDHLTPQQVQFFLNAPGSSPDEKLQNGLPSGPGGPGGETRTRYFHLSPGLYVSKAMLIPQGTPLGYMDDTGHSAFPHLHFSIHQRDLILDGVPYYSIPQSFDGQYLNDNSDANCVCSTNEGPPATGPIS